MTPADHRGVAKCSVPKVSGPARVLVILSLRPSGGGAGEVRQGDPSLAEFLHSL